MADLAAVHVMRLSPEIDGHAVSIRNLTVAVLVGRTMFSVTAYEIGPPQIALRYLTALAETLAARVRAVP
jgi:hypothetical protein